MFWPILLAHLIADYPLQTDDMVQAKKTQLGLAIHVAIHFATLLVLLFGLLRMDLIPTIWPVFVITILHWCIDTWKNIFSKRWPQWIIMGYLQDQILHIISIAGVVYWFVQTYSEYRFATNSTWLMNTCGFILVTHVWFVSERILSYQNRIYHQWMSAQMWPRMMSRAMLFSTAFLGWNIWGAIALIIGLGLHWFDLAGPYRWRAMVIDIAITFGVMGTFQVFLALGFLP